MKKSFDFNYSYGNLPPGFRQIKKIFTGQDTACFLPGRCFQSYFKDRWSFPALSENIRESKSSISYNSAAHTMKSTVVIDRVFSPPMGGVTHLILSVLLWSPPFLYRSALTQKIRLPILFLNLLSFIYGDFSLPAAAIADSGKE